jgi:phosphatidylserine decarboxylase
VSFAPEGYPFAATGLALAGAAWIGVWLTNGGIVWTLAAAALSLLAVFVLWFFRNPKRDLPADASLVVAPGEGRVIGIDEVEEGAFLGAAAHKISIFLSVFDVHVQRAPVGGTVELKTYRPGSYAVAWADKASDDNEQAALGISTPNGRVLVRQIAGLVARRIITDPSEGDVVERGQRIGLIRFGSRVDLFLPRSWEVLCAVGDRARVGATVLARQVTAPALVDGEGRDSTSVETADIGGGRDAHDGERAT